MTLASSFSELTYDQILADYWGLAAATIERYADKEFIVTPQARLTYAQFEQRANVAYAAIHALGLPRQTGVGIFMDEATEIVPAYFGALKANHYFAVFGVDYPAARIQAMVRVAEMKLIVANERHIPQLRAALGDDFLILNYDRLDFDQTLPSPVVQYDPDDKVQILFTSGSTGDPKGAIQTYRSWAYIGYLKTATFDFNVNERIFQISNFMFSATHTLPVGGLLIGYTVGLFDIRKLGLVEFAQWLLNERITDYTSTVTIFRGLCNVIDANEEFPDIKKARLSGEKQSPRDHAAFRKHFPNVTQNRLALASTETMSIAYEFVDINKDFSDELIPVGFPHDHLKVYIWDEDQNSLPVGQEGEIVVYSDRLAAGYINNPELTRQKFIPDPDNPTYQYFRPGR